ncbi:MAG: ADP-ribosyl-[dinitrogen reductase] hydrolase [Methylococcaceae bacterium]|nr:ADP-ribosyl-[dinitrogen reductase] hydrolase [Methylococcaceae bacterium]
MNSLPGVEGRALGAYLGLACGDALGATVEFMTPAQIRAAHGVHLDIVGGGWLGLRPGQVTDDTEMSLALGQAIVDRGGWDLQAVAESFVSWLAGKPVDVGNTCYRGIRRYLTEGTLSSTPCEQEGGNGACMRNLPVALATLGRDQALISWSVDQCHITHNHHLSDAATVAMGRMVQILVAGGGRESCRPIADRLVADHPEFRFSPYPGRAGGYIVDTVQTVLNFFFATDDLESCIVETVNRGEDADTTGALAGMLAGACYGAEAIPRRWLDRLDPNCQRRIGDQVAGLLAVARGEC